VDDDEELLWVDAAAGSTFKFLDEVDEAAFIGSAVIAAEAVGHLAGLLGCAGLRVGYRYDPDEFPDEFARRGACWWVSVKIEGGARVTIEDHETCAAACDALARKLLSWSRCMFCGRRALTTPLNVSGAGRCRWVRDGPVWRSECSP